VDRCDLREIGLLEELGVGHGAGVDGANRLHGLIEIRDLLRGRLGLSANILTGGGS